VGKNIDSLIKDIFEEEFQNIQYPSSDEMWEHIRIRLKHEKRKILLKKLRPAFAASIFISAVSVISIYLQTPIRAWVNRIIKSMREFAGSTMKIPEKDGARDIKEEADGINNVHDPRLGEAAKK